MSSYIFIIRNNNKYTVEFWTTWELGVLPLWAAEKPSIDITLQLALHILGSASVDSTNQYCSVCPLKKIPIKVYLCNSNSPCIGQLYFYFENKK